jgi:hypothetical protein
MTLFWVIKRALFWALFGGVSECQILRRVVNFFFLALFGARNRKVWTLVPWIEKVGSPRPRLIKNPGPN